MSGALIRRRDPERNLARFYAVNLLAERRGTHTQIAATAVGRCCPMRTDGHVSCARPKRPARGQDYSRHHHQRPRVAEFGDGRR
jgi:hypothetical protein